MRIKYECAECIVRRVSKEIALATDDEELRFRTLKTVLKKLFNEFNEDSNPAKLGTLKDILIKDLTGAEDYYKDLKKTANKTALALAEQLRKKINNIPSEYERLRQSVLAAIAGNSMEFFIIGSDFKINNLDLIQENTEKDLIIDDIREFYEIIRKKSKILYLTDNAGEIAFDTLLVEQLVNVGSEVYVAVKDKPVMNDATLEDAEYVGMSKFATEVITNGSSSIGLIPSDCSKDFLNHLESSDLIISKGMGYYETLSEAKIHKPVLILLRSKCLPVARDLNVPQNKNVAKLIYSTDELGH
ncbi:MAG: damage-control phosphatase ARMT1 family protein [Candidatus Odinarchaeia archaeon]